MILLVSVGKQWIIRSDPLMDSFQEVCTWNTSSVLPDYLSQNLVKAIGTHVPNDLLLKSCALKSRHLKNNLPINCVHVCLQEKVERNWNLDRNKRREANWGVPVTLWCSGMMVALSRRDLHMIHELHLTPARSEHLAMGEACSDSFSKNLDCQWQHRKENGRQPLRESTGKGTFTLLTLFMIRHRWFNGTILVRR